MRSPDTDTGLRSDVGKWIRTVDTGGFIAPVPAVVLMVALTAPMDTRSIIAFKLIWTTGPTICREPRGRD